MQNFNRKVPGKRVSCKKVGEILGMEPKDVRRKCEAFGKDVRAYLYGDPFPMSQKLIRENVRHNVRDNRVEVFVTYFKAWHWDE